MFAKTIKDLDWIDIAIHVGLAIVGISLLRLAGVPLWLVITVNTLVWPAREWFQKVQPNGDEESHQRFGEATYAIFTRPQPLMEWVCPVLVGFIVFGVLS